ncbi:MAG TPA: RHS repeat-associated core domain-containing protein, partial [Methylomirabilota bacterium]|nr:RHS repeat-associated core domain-containing protein [Methylomirabilota bacterium]
TAAAAPPRVVKLLRQELVHDGEGGVNAGGPVQVTVTHLDGFGRPLQHKLLTEPGPALLRDGAGNLVLDVAGRPVEGPPTNRWLVSGHTLYSDKQQPVRVYEPYYSSTPAWEAEPALAGFGAFRQFQYDALGRLVREDHANGAHERVEHGAWAIRQFDPNDAVMDSLYRTLRGTLPPGNAERRALQKAEAHADTPVVLHLDPHGRQVRRVDTAPDGNHRSTETLVDRAGRVLSVVDPRGLTAFTYRLDMLGRRLLAHSMDAGDTWTLPDLHDRPLHAWDSRGVHQRRAFDALDRPTSVTVQAGAGPGRLAEQLVYGEDPTVAQAALRNARGRLVLHRDQAGAVAYEQYDLEGRVLRLERRFHADHRTEPDWTDAGAVVLDAARHRTVVAYDALGRVRRQSLPDGSVRRSEYLLGGGLARVVVDTADGAVAGLAVLDGTAFNARGDRAWSRLGNGVEVTRRFDPETFHTSRLTARRPPQSLGETPVTLQDVAYTYDPVGNIVHAVDHAQDPGGPAGVIQGLAVSAETDYTYDAFYQLRAATGRVHQALLEHDYRPHLPTPGVLKGTRHLALNNGAAVERYTRTYEYDLAGNLRRLHHQGLTRSWATEMWISPASNRSVPAFDPAGNPTVDPAASFDAAGNCVRLPHLRRLEWTVRNSLARAVIVDRAAAGQPDDAEYYVYDGNGLRVRKVTERLVNGQVEVTDTLYVDGGEIKRVRAGGQALLERLTSHVSDGVTRVASLQRWTADVQARETDDVDRPRVRYPLGDHLGSAQLELDETGAVASYEEYFPFGGSAFVAGDNVREIELKDAHFCGKERDDATGFLYFEYRYYVPWMARWLSPDPIGPEDDDNLYRYVRNNPVNLIDPDGLKPRRPTPAPAEGEGTIDVVRGSLSGELLEAYDRLSPEQKAQYAAGTIG